MFRIAIVALAIVGLVSLFSSGASAAATGAGFLLLFPLLILAKVLFVVMLFGLIGRGFHFGGRRGEGMRWGRWERPKSDTSTRDSREEGFEEWHRMAHAREEVNSWTEDVDRL